MITTVAAWLVSKGVSSNLAKPLIYALMAILASGALFGLKSCYDASVVENAVNKANIETLETKGAADEKAADARVADSDEINEMKKGYDDALQDKDGYPADPAVRLACKQLLTSGKKPADLPATCGCDGRKICYGVETGS